MKKQILTLFSLAVLGLGALSSCSQDRDVQDSIELTQGEEVQGSLEEQSANLDFNGTFSIAPVSLDKGTQSEDDLRSLKFQLSKTGATFKDGRRLHYEYDDNEELDAMLIIRCKGQKVSKSATDATLVDMPYFYNMIKLVYHKTGAHQGKFTAKANHLHFQWNGPTFDEIKTNTGDRKWQLRLVLTRQMTSLVPANGTVPTAQKIALGDITNDGVDAKDPVDDTTPVYNLTDYKLSDGLLDVDQVCKDSAVPFYSDWQDIEFAEQTGGTATEPKAQYSFSVAGSAPVTLKPKGVFVLLNLSTANDLPMDLTARGIQVQTSAYSFAGELDFSEASLKANEGEPKWLPSDKFLDYQPAERISKTPIYTKHFKFVDKDGQDKLVLLPKSQNTGDKHLYLFWAMPTKVEGVTNTANYFTQIYLKTELTNPSDEASESATDDAKFVRTNRNIKQFDKGKVAAVFEGDGRELSALAILQGGNAYLEHGVVGNSKVSRQIPSVKNYPLYSSTKFSIASDGTLQQGRILYAETKAISRAITFLEYMSETPCVNGQTGAGTNAENAGVFCAKNPTPHFPVSASGDEFHFTYAEAEARATENTLGYQTKLPEAIELGTYFRTTHSAGDAGEVAELESIPSDLILNSPAEEHWLYVMLARFGGYVFQDMGAGNPIKSMRIEEGTDSQLWKIVAKDKNNPLADFELINKATGNYIRYVNGAFRTKPISELGEHPANLSFTKFDRNDFGQSQWVLKANGVPNGQSLNPYGGLQQGRDLKSYQDRDPSNSLLFLDDKYQFNTDVYIKFRNDMQFVVQDMGVDTEVRVKRRVDDNLNQVWTVVAKNPDNPYADFELVNKGTGNYLVFEGGTFRTKAGSAMANSPANLKLELIQGRRVFKANGLPNGRAMNCLGGIGENKTLGHWNDTDANAGMELQAVSPKDYVKLSAKGVGPYNLSQNFKSRLPFEASAQERPTYVFRGDDDSKIFYAVRYMDHEDGLTCTDDSRPSPLHEDGDWHNCNKRRCLVRYQTDMASMTAVTVRYVGQNDALASRTNPIWAEEAFWQRNQVDDVVRYYTRYYGYYNGATGRYGFAPSLGSYWTSQNALSAAPAGSKEVILLDAPTVPTSYKPLLHNYGVYTGAEASQSRLPLYLFMDIKTWGE